jgi:lysophospholipase L1-like esterase
MITPIISPPHESLRNAAGLSLGEVRATVERATAALQDLGDELLTLVDGRELIGTADATLLLDDVHPSADGYRLMAARIMPFLSEAGRPAIQAQGS